MYEKKVSWLVVKATTGEPVCREESLQAALDTVDAVSGLEVTLEVTITIKKPINEMGKEIDIRA